MSVRVYDPIPGHFDHRSGDCPIHGFNVPHARVRGSRGHYSCVECLLGAAGAVADRELVPSPPLVVPPPAAPPVVPPSVPPPRPVAAPARRAVPPPPPADPAVSVRYRDAARLLRAMLDPEQGLYKAIKGVAKLCEIAAGPPNEREACHRVVSDLTHLDDSEPEFWEAFEYVMRERAQVRAQGYVIGRAELANGGNPGQGWRSRYEALLAAAKELNALLDSGNWTDASWRAVRGKLRGLL